MARTIDACVHQWTVDLEEMKEMVPDRWQRRLGIKSTLKDPVSGTLMPTLPWAHAYWGEDHPDATADGGYTDSDTYRSPSAVDAELADQGVDAALLCGHEMKFLPALPNPDYAASLATAYNDLLKQRWLAESDRLKGAVLVSVGDPERAAEEIQRWADDPDMVAVVVYGNRELSLGHKYLRPLFGAAAEAGMPVMIHTSGNAIRRQTAMGMPEKYASYDAMLVHNHMTNFLTMVFQGLFDEFPDLQVVWAGEEFSWMHHVMWRSTRYYRNLEDASSPQEVEQLEREPHEYARENCWYTTYPLGELPETTTNGLVDMLGEDRLLYASGWPHWNADTPETLSVFDGEQRREAIGGGNAAALFGM
ncbi:amidohydrolase family protein [Halorarius halobius]|uniref:amidohydrolase family protein n=1 Tax=Halorarius halobius TaxID=2962671 RepID=UPI0020CB7154|nr:amidohydrolase family protein [Halorarius halobius]